MQSGSIVIESGKKNDAAKMSPQIKITDANGADVIRAIVEATQADLPIKRPDNTIDKLEIQISPAKTLRKVKWKVDTHKEKDVKIHPHSICGRAPDKGKGAQPFGTTQVSPTKKCGKIILRSGLSLMRYLGAIDRHYDRLPSDFNRPINIKKGRPPNKIAVSVKYDGQSYYVVDYKYKTDNGEDYSMETLALVSLLLALNKSSEELSATPTVISVGP